MDKISVIVPCYNEEESLPLYYGETSAVLASIDGTDPVSYTHLDVYKRQTEQVLNSHLSKGHMPEAFVCGICPFLLLYYRGKGACSP